MKNKKALKLLIILISAVLAVLLICFYIVFHSIAKSPFLDIVSAVKNTLETESFHFEIYNDSQQAAVKSDIAFDTNNKYVTIHLNVFIMDIVSVYNNGECTVLYKSVISKSWKPFQNKEIFSDISEVLISPNRSDDIYEIIKNTVPALISSLSLEDTYNTEEYLNAIKKMYFNFSFPKTLKNNLGYERSSEDNTDTISFSFSEKFIKDKYYSYTKKAFKSEEKYDEALKEWNNRKEKGEYKNKISLSFEITNNIIDKIIYNNGDKNIMIIITNTGKTTPDIPSELNS